MTSSVPDVATTFLPVDVPKGGFLLGHLKEFRQRPLDTMASWHTRYGDFVRFRLGPRLFYLVSHPALAEEVLQHKSDMFVKVYEPNKPTGLALVLGNGLLTSTGEVWRRHRRMIQPGFHRSHIRSLSQRMVDVGALLLERWEHLDPNQPIDIASEMMRVTLEIITQTMASTSVRNEIEQIEPTLRVLLRYAFNAFHNPLRLPGWVPTRANREFKRAKASLDSLIYSLIANRRRSGERHDDLLDLLLHAKDEETGVGLTDQQLRDELMTIFSAGHETTANALSWTWYLLATHPDVRTKLHHELETVLGGFRPTDEEVSRLRYTRAVFEEALRLYPPAPAVQRRAAEDTTLGNHRIPSGSIVVIAIRNIHRHPKFWLAPDRFNPDRFLEEHPPDHRLAFLPFGAGPRLCVGSHFAMMEGVLMLALIAQRFTLSLVPDHLVECELAITLRPRYGLKMMLRER